MCGRFEGMKRYGIAVFTAVLFLSLPVARCYGQNLPDNIVRILEDVSESGGKDTETLMLYLEGLLSSPLDINQASEDELARFPLLSQFQILSLLEYREEYGKLVSFSELALVDGFDEGTVSELRPFITLDDGAGAGFSTSKKQTVKNTAILRAKWTLGPDENKYLGAPYYRYVRYGLDYSGRIKAGVTMENDVGEKNFPDFLSAYVQVKDLRLGKKVALKSAVIGDYSVRTGQGLVLWNSFAITGLSAPSSVIKRESPVVPYASSTEYGFFRGTAATFDFGKKISASVYFSYHMADAKTDSVAFYSLPEDGVHNTESSFEKRRTLGEYMLGGNVSYRTDRFKVGFTSATYGFEKKNLRPIKEYNKYMMYDGWWGNASVDALYSWRRLKCFAEVAVDYSGALATITGADYVFKQSLEVSLLYRYYSHKYIARFAGAYTASSECNNENGAMANFRWGATRSLVLSGYVDFAYHPWMRYAAPPHSKSLKTILQAEWTVVEGHELDLRCSFRWDDYKSVTKSGIRAVYACNVFPGWVFTSRVETSVAAAMGYLICGDVSYSASACKLNLTLRTACFHVDDWDNRIYCYDRDLPGTFSVPAYYRRGMNVGLFAKYKPLRWLEMTTKIGWTKYLDTPDKDNLKLKGQITLLF